MQDIPDLPINPTRWGAFWPALAGILPLALLLILALGWQAWSERQRLLEEGAQLLENETSLLATHLGYAMEAVELSLIDFSLDLQEHQLMQSGVEDLLLALEDRVAALPQLTELRFYGAAGEWLGSSDPRQQPIPLDTQLLIAHDRDGQDFVISGPAPSGRPRGRFLSISRAARDDSDRFLGLIQALIDVQCLGELCNMVALESVVAGVVVDQDLRILASWQRDGWDPPVAGESVDHWPIFRMLNQGSVQRPLGLLVDGTSLVAVGLPRGMPWRVALATDHDRLLLGWRQRVWLRGLLCTGLLVVLGIFLGYIRHQDHHQQRMDRRLADAMAEQMAIFDSAAEGIAMTLQGCLIRANRRFAAIVGFPAEALQGKETWTLFPSREDHRRLVEVANAALQTGTHYEGEWQIRHRDGRLIWCRLSGAVLDSLQPGRMVWCIDDITERKRLEAELRRLATTDTLTGLLNRRRFTEIAEQELRRMKRHPRPLALLMLDLDHFKQINDNHGHPAGDRVLQAVTAACSRLLRSTDSFGRLGGEEFAILLPDTAGVGALDVAEKLREAVASLLIPVDGATLRVTVSIGMICRQAGDQSLTDLLSSADHALYRAKAGGRNRTVGEIDPPGVDVQTGC